MAQEYLRFRIIDKTAGLNIPIPKSNCGNVPNASVFNRLDLSGAGAMYNPDHSGILLIRNALEKSFHAAISRQVLELGDMLRKVKPVEGNVRQNFFTVYLLDDDSHSNVFCKRRSMFPACDQLAMAYTKHIYNFVANAAGFMQTSSVNSLSINMYPKNVGRIEYHKDFSAEINLIGIISVIGSARFSVAKSRDGTDEKSHVVNEGDLVLMRANRDLGKAALPSLTALKRRDAIERSVDLRPYHRVEALDEDRYSIVLRKDVPD